MEPAEAGLGELGAACATLRLPGGPVSAGVARGLCEVWRCGRMPLGSNQARLACIMEPCCARCPKPCHNSSPSGDLTHCRIEVARSRPLPNAYLAGCRHLCPSRPLANAPMVAGCLTQQVKLPGGRDGWVGWQVLPPLAAPLPAPQPLHKIVPS